MRPIKIARDVAYGWPMQYQAVPLLDLLRGLPTSDISTLEARAKDGFVSEIPWNLVARGDSGQAVAWIAIEDPHHPWPHLHGKPNSAGPFYLVCRLLLEKKNTSEQWPFALMSLT